MKLLPLLWRHRKVIIWSAVVAVIAALPFAVFLKPASYNSTSTVLFSPNEPAVDNAHQESVLSLRLSDYTDNYFEGAVDKALGKQAGAVASVSGDQTKTDPIEYTVTVSASSPKAATAAVKVADKVLTDRYAAILSEEVANIEKDVTTQLGPLTAKKTDLDAQVAARKTELDALQQQINGLDSRMDSIRAATAKDTLAGSTASSAAADRAVAPIQAQKNALLPALTAKRAAVGQATADSSQVDSEVTTLLQALSDAKKTALSSQAASNVTPPDTPVPNTLIRIVETVGFGLVIGLVVACVSIVWVERSPIWGWTKTTFRRLIGEDGREAESEEAPPAASVLPEEPPSPSGEPASEHPTPPTPAAYPQPTPSEGQRLATGDGGATGPERAPAESPTQFVRES